MDLVTPKKQRKPPVTTKDLFFVCFRSGVKKNEKNVNGILLSNVFVGVLGICFGFETM